MNKPGLRERKKQRTRWSVQEHALRLFAEQGYEATTVEQIAAAAEISPSTFFRYFRTKEDVVIEDDYDPLLAAAMLAAPTDLKPLPAIRHGMRTVFAQVGDAERRGIFERTKLIMSVPALRARTLENLTASIKLIAEPVARRTGRSPDDFAVRVFAGACVGALVAVLESWVEAEGRENLSDLMDRALAVLEDGFAF
jgi:AcrR family transcriptional regulator